MKAILAVILILVVSMTVLTLAINFVSYILMRSSGHPLSVQTKLYLSIYIWIPIFYGAILLVIWYFGIKKYQGNLSDLGFRKFNLLTLAKQLAFWLPLFILLVFLYSLAMKSIFHYEVPVHESVSMLLKQKVMLPMIIFLVSILGPFCEEILFRGFIYTALRKRLGIYIGIIVSSLIFTLVHSFEYAGLLALFPIFILGIILAYLYERNKSLYPSIFLHACYNFAALGIFLITGGK